MRQREHTFFGKLDWWSVAVYLLLVLIGWISIFSAVYDPEHGQIFDTTQRYGMQMIWIFGAWLLAIVILVIPARIYALFSNVIYFFGLLLLLAVLVLGVERGGPAPGWYWVLFIFSLPR